MAETSAISWTRSTFNPWIGCTKVGPGCDHCYAEAQDARKRWGGAAHWGAGVPRYRTSASNWNGPLKWNRLAAEEQRTGLLTPKSEWTGRVGFWPVFCASLADVFDNEVPQVWRHDLFKLIVDTPHLSWLLVTKRIGNVAKMWPVMMESPPPNVRLLITVVNQEEANRDIPKLLALPCKNGISYEPALGPVDWKPFVKLGFTRRLQWIIVGGESAQGGAKARPFAIEWARLTIRQCKAAGVPVFMKQVGSDFGHCGPDGYEPSIIRYPMKDRAGADPSEWPEDLRVQEFQA